MGYQRGSEEFYRGPNGTYNPDTLNLLQSQQRRMLDQQDRQGQMYAEGIESSGRELGSMIGNAPGAYMKGAEFKQANERHQMGTEEHQDHLRNSAQSRDVNQVNMDRTRQEMDRTRFEMEQAKRKQDFLSGASGPARPPGAEEAYMTPEQKMWLAEVETPGLSNKSMKAGIEGQRLAAEQARQTQERQSMEDQARVDAFLSQNPGAVAPRAGTPEFKQALVKANSAGIQGSAAFTKNTAFNSSPEGQLAVQQVVALEPKMAALRRLVDAESSLSNASWIPGKDLAEKSAAESDADRSMRELLGENQGLSSYGNDLTPTFKSTQVSQAKARAIRNLDVEVKNLEASLGQNGGSPAMQQKLASYKNILMQLQGGQNPFLNQAPPPAAPPGGGQQKSGGAIKRAGMSEQSPRRTTPSMFEPNPVGMVK